MLPYNLTGIYSNQEEVKQALSFYQQSLDLKEKIGDVQSKAATLAMMGQLLADSKRDTQQGLNYLHQFLKVLQRLCSPDAATVQAIINRIQSGLCPPPNPSEEGNLDFGETSFSIKQPGLIFPVPTKTIQSSYPIPSVKAFAAAPVTGIPT